MKESPTAGERHRPPHYRMGATLNSSPGAAARGITPSVPRDSALLPVPPHQPPVFMDLRFSITPLNASMRILICSKSSWE